MINIISQGDKTMPHVGEFVADTESDVSKISTSSISPGSTCIVIETSNVYMLNSSKEWKLL